MKPPSTIVKILAGIRTVNGILAAEANHATRAMPYSNITKYNLKSKRPSKKLPLYLTEIAFKEACTTVVNNIDSNKIP